MVYREGDLNPNEVYFVKEGEFTMTKTVQTRKKEVEEQEESVTKVKSQQITITVLG